MSEFIKDIDRKIAELQSQKESHSQIFEALKSEFGESSVFDQSSKLLPSVEVHPDFIKKVISFLMHSAFKADMLDSISGVDLQKFTDPAIERLSPSYSCEEEVKRLFLLNYTLISAELNKEYNLKVFLPECRLQIETIDSLFGNANWLEREIYDLLGVDFIGSKDQRRIMLPQDWIGHPLRKDYVEQESYAGMSTRRENPLPELEARGLELRKVVLGQ
jgi:NADH:ubiquinone oxidoreductase subunit C